MININNSKNMILEKNELISVNSINLKIKKVLNQIAKRSIDIIVGIIGLVILIPLTVIVTVLNLFEKEKGPIFFTQKRIGKDRKLFKMYKYRTMIVDADKELEKILIEDEELKREYEKNKKMKNDPRITKTGRFLRYLSLDEFPQFINVLKGEMSLVGPRPYLPREKKDMEHYYNYIIKYKPGITGVWQISGRSNVSFKDRMVMDMKYYHNKNVFNDIVIIARTIVKTIKREGVA